MESIFKYFEQNREWLDQRIDSGIEQNRKGLMHLSIVDKDQKPIKNAKVSIKQIGSEFNFGCNIFMLDGFDNDKDNKTYRESFASIFNLAIAPFYWQDVEPKEGELRFDKNSEKIERRPAPGLVMEYCKENNIRCKGHVLVWHNPRIGVPEWVPINQEERFSYIESYVKNVAHEFKNEVKQFDIVNEMLYHRKARQLNFPKDYVEKSFKLAEKYFDSNNELFINEGTDLSWKNFDYELSYYYLLIETLMLKGCKIDGIGLQYHMKKDYETLKEQADLFLNPERLFNVLDFYGSLGKKLHISEITLPTYSYSEKDEELQAKLVYELYRLWFSHSAVDAIIWWNFVDGTAYKSENVFKAGLLREDLSEKPSYKVLKKLILEDWRTNIEKQLTTNTMTTKAFYGTYEIIVDVDGKTTKNILEFKKGDYNHFVINTDGEITMGLDDLRYKYSMA